MRNNRGWQPSAMSQPGEPPHAGSGVVTAHNTVPSEAKSGIFYRDENGKEHAIKEVEGLPANGMLIMLLRDHMTDSAYARMKAECEELLPGRKVLLLENVDKIMTLED